MSEGKLGQKKIENIKEVSGAWRNVNSIIAMVGTLLILIGLPLVFQDYYFNILKVKYYFYCTVVIAMAVALIITAIIFYYIYTKEIEGRAIKNIINKLSLCSLSVPDWAMIAFVVAATISTFQSDYIYESFWGNEGRFCGLFLILLYGICFFIVSRYLDFKQWYLDAFLAAGVVVSSIGILHFFKIDPIGFKENITPYDYDIFTSTIGNINTYTSYIALIAGASVVLFSMEENAVKKIWYTFCMVLAFCSLLMGASDNAYLALVALLGLLPLYLFDKLKGIKNYVCILAILASEFMLIGCISDKWAEKVLDISGIFKIVSGFNLLPYITLALWLITAALHVVDCRQRQSRENNIGRYIWLGLIILVSIVVIYILYDANLRGDGEKYGILQPYVVLDNNWGTNRGYIWRLAMRIYNDFPIVHKIFGSGPDTFGILTVTQYFDEMAGMYGQKFESVHNEYLQYFVTIGIVGITAYLSLLISSLARMVRNSHNNPAVMAIVFSVISYGAQAVVNISVPIVAPIMMLLIMMGLSDSKNSI